MSYITNDVAALQAALVDSLIELVTESSILIGSLVMMFYLDWKLSLVTLIVVPLIGQAMKIFGRKLKKSGSLIQETYGRNNIIITRNNFWRSCSKIIC